MRGLTELPDSYFERFANRPVKIIPYDPKAKVVTSKYILKLRDLLSNFKVEILHRGSTAFGIAGKGEIELGVFPVKKDWGGVIDKLKSHFGKVDNEEENYARFNDDYEGFEIEVILMRGKDAEIDKRLTEYLKTHPKLLKEYESIKYKYAFSKKEYMIQKDKFFRRVVAEIPE